MAKAPLTHTYEPNAALRALYARFFDRIQVDESWVRDVRRVAAEGTVVYVLRNLNFVDFLALDHLTKRFGLPQVRFANDLGLWVLNPTGRGFLNALLPRPGITPSDELTEALEAGGSAALFLKRPPGVLDVAAGASGGRGLSEGDALLRTLVHLQRRGSARPILLVPQLFLWTKRPDTRGTQAMDFLLGPREWPSAARTVGQFLLNYKHVELRAGEPFDLSRYLDESNGVTDDVHVRRITYAMLRRLERERRAATGPAGKPPDRVRHELLRSPKLRSVIRDIEQAEDGKASNLVRKADGMLRRLQATPEGSTISALEVLLDRVFHRIYAGVDVDREGLARVREASKEGAVVLLPSHKSHVDYLIVSYVFNDENMQLPLIAAGDNLSFFPLGPVFRRAGAFFIRRSFKGDRLYASVVDAYVRRLLREGFPIEVFLEGGRSRTGKLLPPKFGLLSMIVDAALGLPSKKTVFVPISIGYERIVETHAYQQEMSGREKVKEDAAGLLKTTDVLKHRYGRINLQFGAILTLDDIKRELDIDATGLLGPAKRRAIVTRMGNRVMDEINRVTAVTPGALTALALLSHSRRGLSHEDLVLRCERFLGVLVDMGARVTPATATPTGRLRPGAIREAAAMFARAELIEPHAPAEVDSPKQRNRGGPMAGAGAIYTIAPEQRVELDTSKNIIVHFFVERALVATALLAPPGPPHAIADVRDRVQRLSRLFKIEFRFRADAPFSDIFEDTLKTMEAAGEISRDAGELRPGPGSMGWSGAEWLLTYAAFVQNFVESYRIAARGLGALLKGPLSEKELIKKTLATGQRMFFSGEIERSEAVSQPTVKNAFVVFKELGHLRSSEGKYELSTCTPDAVRAIETEVAGYLGGGREP